jgi:hypothetical protein
MTGKTRKEELERRLKESWRLKRDAADSTAFERLTQLIEDLETGQKDTDEKK